MDAGSWQLLTERLRSKSGTLTNHSITVLPLWRNDPDDYCWMCYRVWVSAFAVRGDRVLKLLLMCAFISGKTSEVLCMPLSEEVAFGGSTVVLLVPQVSFLRGLTFVFFHNWKYPALFEVCMSRECLLFVRVCEWVPALLRTKHSQSAGTITHGKSNLTKSQTLCAALWPTIAVTSY